MTWYYHGKEFTEDDIGNAFGFVYLIENLTNNRKYIGKKFFSKAGRKQVKGKIKKIRKPSDWEDYYGSNDELKKEVEILGKDNFKRVILYLCATKTECSYLELREQIDRRALETETFYNQWISVKVSKKNLKL